MDALLIPDIEQYLAGLARIPPRRLPADQEDRKCPICIIPYHTSEAGEPQKTC